MWTIARQAGQPSRLTMVPLGLVTYLAGLQDPKLSIINMRAKTLWLSNFRHCLPLKTLFLLIVWDSSGGRKRIRRTGRTLRHWLAIFSLLSNRSIPDKESQKRLLGLLRWMCGGNQWDDWNGESRLELVVSVKCTFMTLQKLSGSIVYVISASYDCGLIKHTFGSSISLKLRRRAWSESILTSDCVLGWLHAIMYFGIRC